MKRTLSQELESRGFVHQYTAPTTDEILDKGTITVYQGIDPSADSAHTGNMVIWMLLRHIAQAGHKVIFLVGGGTGMIGDPKPDSERVLQDEAVTDSNVEKIRHQAERLIAADGQEITFVNNKDWLCAEGLVSFLRDIGKHFTVNELIKKDAISKRLESDSGISYTEFAYPLLQAFDYLTLYRNHNCTLQVGGSDQWGNIVAGVDLIRRKEQKVVHALTVPLVIDKATGKKFGKSEGNAIWLDANKTTPFAFYQFWLNASDESVEDYLKLFTFITLEDITTVVNEWQKNPGERHAQRTLAYAVTELVHGKEVATAVQNAAEVMFGGRMIASLDESELSILRASAPFVQVAPGSLLVDVLVESELASSKREARTFIESGAVSIDNEKVMDVEAVCSIDLGKVMLLKRGKKNISIIEVK